ncbi:hypothetical protein Q5424_20960 [Conexibacter sp. JD483]|uniref:hypothetical protein n=1 Tax=unclassified Conexibacter TaxID=2627773 RepID=UPI00271A0442|nr:MULTISPECIES: hypothetical protein [unclassified Conexibacter]MDO8188371.1 hypothetical protein [Conexibacter sp. CPCC 205706]MDO8201117.1 hypothetical protein [Conexibacter sp. CPCC 205762]MDR9371583.1 hypothetical protein [Conexibacter sp. JD483]
MGWGMVWLMLVLKIPIGLLLWLVWWAIRQTPDELGEHDGGDGGSKVPHRPAPHPRSPFPHRPRGRGPHGDPTVAAPARTRTRVTRARTREH